MNILLIHNKVIQKFLPFTRSEDLVDLINLGLLMVLQQFLLVQTLKTASQSLREAKSICFLWLFLDFIPLSLCVVHLI